jgi:hypothetical protein
MMCRFESCPRYLFPFKDMIDELKTKLSSLGMDEEMATKVIETVADFAKTKLPRQVHSAIDDVLAGKKPDLGALGGMLGSLSGLFGGK